MNRRQFTKTVVTSTLVGSGMGLYSWKVEPFWLEFVFLDMPIKNLDHRLVGKTLMQISDLHVGKRFDADFISDSLLRAQKFAPDIVCYTGDYITYESDEQFAQLATVMKHAVHGKMATVGILGNHDYGINWNQNEVAETVVELLENAGIKILRNASSVCEGLKIIGLDDYWGPNFYPHHAFADHQAEESGIVLCHNPDVVDLPVWNDFQGWILSGHTHGGQVKPPFLAPPMLPVKNKKWTAGKFELDEGKKLYINRALGHLWQVRFNVRPEITIFTLKQEI